MALPAAHQQWLPILVECARNGSPVAEGELEVFGREVLLHFPPSPFSSQDLARTGTGDSGITNLRYVEILHKAIRQLVKARLLDPATGGGSWELTQDGEGFLEENLAQRLPNGITLTQVLTSKRCLWELVPDWHKVANRSRSTSRLSKLLDDERSARREWYAHFEGGAPRKPYSREARASLAKLERAKGALVSATATKNFKEAALKLGYEPTYATRAKQPTRTTSQSFSGQESGRNDQHAYADRTEIIRDKILEHGGIATVAELYEALATGPDGLFATPRRIAATIRWDMRQDKPLFERDGSAIRLTVREEAASTTKQQQLADQTSDKTPMTKDQISRALVCIRDCGIDMRAQNHTHSLVDGGAIHSICCSCARKEGSRCQLYIDSAEKPSGRLDEDEGLERSSQRLNALGLGAAAWPHLRGEQRKIALRIGDDISLEEATDFLRGGSGHDMLASSFGTVRRKRDLQTAIDDFKATADRWVTGHIREPKLNWLTPESLHDDHYRLREGWLERLSEPWRSRLEGCQRVSSWLPFLSVEAANVLKKMNPADYAFISTVLGRASLLIGEEGVLKPWRATFQTELGMLPVSYVFQVDATSRLDRILKRLAYAGCHNVGHLIILDQEAWQLSRELPSSEWAKLKLDLERLG